MLPASTTAITLPASIPPDLAAAARRLVDGAQRIAIFGHIHPDPDAVGSALGLGHALRGLGKQCVVAMPDAPDPGYGAFLPGFEQVVTELSGPPFDLLIALDAGDLSRYGDLSLRHQDLLREAPILNFDHHVTSAGCGLVNLIDPASAATAELLTLWLAQEGIAIETEAAQCLLAGIITDTRSFEFDATTARTLLVGAYLRERGAIPYQIVKPMYRLKTFAAAKLFGLVMATIQQDCAGQLIWAEITPAMWAAAGIPVGTQDDGIPSYLIDIHGAAIAICFRQTADDLVRISVRTTEPYDATAITQRFGGGGHPRAGGCAVAGSLAAVQPQVLAVAREQLGNR